MGNIRLSFKLFTYPIFLISIFFLCSITFAATITVTNLNDSGPGSLRQAILESNTTFTEDDEIVFQAGLTGTIFISLGEMLINDDVTINGPGADQITIDAQMASRIFVINDSPVATIATINGLKFINGSGLNGGAILNRGDLTIDLCVFENNSSGNGGAISVNAGMLEITNSAFSENSAEAYGGAIDNFLGTITKISNTNFNNNSAENAGVIINSGLITGISNATFDGNSAILTGGAIWNASPGIIESIKNSTFSNNSATGRGGAIYNQLDRTINEIINSTFSGNSSGVDGGAIWNQGVLNISFTTIANNHADDEGGGIFENGSNTRIRNSIVAFNTASTAGPNCNQDIATLITEVNNSSNDNSCGFDGDNSIIMLGPLSNNGGATQTLPLLGGAPVDGASAACDPFNRFGVPTGFSVNIDQRNFPRPYGASCDIGSYEKSIILNPLNPSEAGAQNSISANNVSSNGNVSFIWSLGLNTSAQVNLLSTNSAEISTNVAPDNICLGLQTPLKNPRILATVQADGNGDAFFGFNMPLIAEGLTIFFQAVDISSCTGSVVNEETIGPPTQSVIMLQPLDPGTAGQQNTLTATDATPNNSVRFIWGFNQGNQTANNICPGFQSGIINPRILATVSSNGSGNASHTFKVPNAGAGLTVVLQAVDLATCTGSNVNAENL